MPRAAAEDEEMSDRVLETQIVPNNQSIVTSAAALKTTPAPWDTMARDLFMVGIAQRRALWNFYKHPAEHVFHSFACACLAGESVELAG